MQYLEMHEKKIVTLDDAEAFFSRSEAVRKGA